MGAAGAPGDEPEPLYPVFENDRWGLIDASGQVILKPRFDQIGGRSTWIPETWDAAGVPGQVLVHMTLSKGVPVTDLVIPVRLNGKLALATRGGGILAHGKYEHLERRFSDGLLAVRSGGLTGFVNETGALVVPARWEADYPYRKGHAFVKAAGRWGVIDRTGKVVVEPRWDQVSYPTTELTTVRVVADWGVVDYTGTVRVPVRFDEIRVTATEPLLPVRDDGRTLYVRPNGKGTVAFEFLCPKKRDRKRSRGFPFFDPRAAIVKCDDTHGLIDVTGAFLLQPEWERIGIFSEGRAIVRNRGMQGLIDDAGKFIIEPERDLLLHCCIDGLVGFNRDGVEGHMDLDGRVLFTVAAERVGWFKQGLAVARRNGKDGYIYATGAWVIEPRSHRARPFDGPLAFVEQPVSTDLLEVGYIDRKGEVVYRTRLGGFRHPERLVEPAGIARRQ